MAHGAHGASGWVSSGNRPDREHEGPGGASDCGIRSAEQRLGSDQRRSEGSKLTDGRDRRAMITARLTGVNNRELEETYGRLEETGG